jgi:hypothetical protein
MIRPNYRAVHLNRRDRGACRRTVAGQPLPVLGAKSTATGEAPAGGRGSPVRRHPLGVSIQVRYGNS